MSSDRIVGNASSCLSEPAVTHNTSGSSPNHARICGGCGKQFRPKRPWQKQCSPRCRQRAYVQRHPTTTLLYYGA